jgi:ComF family protein
VLPQLARLKGMALNLLLPQWCLGCGREGELICSSCRDRLPRITSPICPRCGIPQPSETLCPSCVSCQQVIDGIRSSFRFGGVIRQAIHQLKYRNLRAITGTLAELLGDYLATNPVPGEVLVPVPIHQKRLRERGYNQSELLSRELGRIIKLPVMADCLTRQKHSLPQARTTSISERWSNVAAAFACYDHRLKDKQIILIDDVATSGATLDACATALKTAGASSVWGLTIAREV